jgi:hypothetical protein
MEVGKYIDFHASAGNSVDYDVRITAATTGLTISGTTSGTFSGNLTGNADTATTATNLAAKPSLAAGSSDTKKITVTAGGKTSDEFTVPYATYTKYVEGTNDAQNPGGALLHSGAGRADNSTTGDTWIFWDTLGGTSKPWGIRHAQGANRI